MQRLYEGAWLDQEVVRFFRRITVELRPAILHLVCLCTCSPQHVDNDIIKR